MTMTQTENDYYEIKLKSIVNHKDFRAPLSYYPSHKFKYMTHGSPLINLEKYLFVVDWQLKMEENLNNEIQWI
jgi:hypothetical protein